ncbi:DUF2267 domain-containing protein [Spirulina sp. CS-785/01]|uniref:DUF2267 domain-containing protein n=1 Tax=Spirulina sp. CS-785/01 TaxID=3021716 RepID=UPI00232B7152|nr:DUF2267 domain-containing protein [Spirulina sp. CS-785/01]MDB9313811.1 DUF2267 domain-containing protein [Spirulina sp. CS-785/01]
MTITIRDDIVYVLLRKIGQSNETGQQSVDFEATDFTGIPITPANFLGHLDYLNQEGYIEAEFTGNAYATQEDVPDLVNMEEVDLRVANTLGAADGPLPHLIRFKKATLTEKGKEMWSQMESKPPQIIEEGPAVPAAATQNLSFLEKIQLKGELSDLYDARDLAVIVYRTMRDLIPTDEVDRVADELDDATVQPTEEKALQYDVAQLWQDTNPLVGWLSRLRSPLHFDDDTFIFRINQEGGVPKGTTGERVIKAVFSATKEELSQERVNAIAQFLPGQVKQMWQSA